jgi:hypothetical protein
MNPTGIRNPPNAVLGPHGPTPDANVRTSACNADTERDCAVFRQALQRGYASRIFSACHCPDADSTCALVHLCGYSVAVRSSTYAPRTPQKFRRLAISTSIRPPRCAAPSARSKSFPAQSNSYKAGPTARLYFVCLRDGTSCANERTDEVARNGALQGRLRPEVFLGAPCITPLKPSPIPWS